MSVASFLSLFQTQMSLSAVVFGLPSAIQLPSSETSPTWYPPSFWKTRALPYPFVS